MSHENSYLIAAAASDSFSKSLPSNSLKSKVLTEAPFDEVGKFNGRGNEMGSAIAATAEITQSPAQDVIARFSGFSDVHNRESVVLAAFAPAGEIKKPVAPRVSNEQIAKLNSASAAFGMVRKQSERQVYELVDFDVSGSDKLVVSIATERDSPEEIDVTYAGRKLTKAVQLDGATTVGIYYLDNPEDIAPQGTIFANLSDDKPNGAALHAVSLSGTAPGVSDVEKGEVGNPFGSLNVSHHNSYVMAAAASDNISNSVRSNSPESEVSTEPPFIEVGEFNGQGNEMGSALAATAEVVDSPAQNLTASFPGLSNRRNRESVVLAAFAPAKVSDSRTSITSSTYTIPAVNRRITFYSSDAYVDTVPLIDLKKDAPSGNWFRDKDLLVATSAPVAKPLSIPLSVAGSYSLGVIYRTSSPKSSIRLGLPVGSQRSVLRLGYKDGAGVALDGLEGIKFSDSRNLAANHNLKLPPNIDHKFNIVVTYKGDLAQISVTKEFHNKLIDWSGPRHKISPPAEIDRHPFGSGLTLACDTPTEIVFFRTTHPSKWKE